MVVNFFGEEKWESAPERKSWLLVWENAVINAYLCLTLVWGPQMVNPTLLRIISSFGPLEKLAWKISGAQSPQLSLALFDCAVI